MFLSFIWIFRIFSTVNLCVQATSVTSVLSLSPEPGALNSEIFDAINYLMLFQALEHSPIVSYCSQLYVDFGCHGRCFVSHLVVLGELLRTATCFAF